MGVVFAIFLLPLVAAVLVLILFMELCSRIFVFMAPQIFIAVLITYFHLKKKNVFEEHESKALNTASLLLRILMIIYMLFNILLFLVCLVYLIVV